MNHVNVWNFLCITIKWFVNVAECVIKLNLVIINFYMSYAKMCLFKKQIVKKSAFKSPKVFQINASYSDSS